MLTFLVALSLSTIWKGCLSAPIESSDPSSPPTVHWISEPDGRGTFGLLSSCSITMILCIWTSLHLNIPPQDDTRARRTARKLIWILVALLAPELVVYVAWWQRSSAMVLSTEVNRILDGEHTGENEKTTNSSVIKHRWTMMHGFYASMGGYVLEIDPKTQPFIPDMIGRNSPLRLTLTARGVLLLAKCGHLQHFPLIPEEHLADRSKFDSLARTIVCLQAGWSLLHIVARLATQLPVTLLEISTVGHVLCALAIYLSWWSKPQNITSPTVISGEWIPPICAYMWMSSTISGGAVASRPYKPELRSLGVSFSEPTSEMYSTGHSQEESYSSGVAWPKPLAEGHTLPNTVFTLNREWLSSHTLLQVIELDPVDVRRWELASEAIRNHPAVVDNYNRFDEIVRSAGDELVVQHAPNWPSWDLLGDSVNFQTFFTLSLTGLFYGGMHAAAWNAFFPSSIERLIWRIASLYIIAFGFICYVLMMVLYVAYKPRAKGKHVGDTAVNVVIWIFLLLVVIYFPFKLFLVVEAFISVRELTLDAYKTPNWTQLIPHF